LIQNILFDFDGVICESVDIKTDAFYELYLPEGKVIAEAVKKHHIENGGMARYDKFRHYETKFIGKDLTEERMESLSKEFSCLVKKKVIAASFVVGALEFLKEFSQNYKCFIISATPIDEMKEIAREKNIDIFFKEIFGSPKDKTTWAKYILETYELKAKETLFIGDARSDYGAAKANDMHFLLRRTKDNKKLFDKTVSSMPDLKNLNVYITEQFDS